MLGLAAAFARDRVTFRPRRGHCDRRISRRMIVSLCEEALAANPANTKRPSYLSLHESWSRLACVHQPPILVALGNLQPFSASWADVVRDLALVRFQRGPMHENAPHFAGDIDEIVHPRGGDGSPLRRGSAGATAVQRSGVTLHLSS